MRDQQTKEDLLVGSRSPYEIAELYFEEQDAKHQALASARDSHDRYRRTYQSLVEREAELRKYHERIIQLEAELEQRVTFRAWLRGVFR